jgi:hypothetical protein
MRRPGRGILKKHTHQKRKVAAARELATDGYAARSVGGWWVLVQFRVAD